MPLLYIVQIGCLWILGCWCSLSFQKCYNFERKETANNLIWTQQLGTFQYPKSPNLSQSARLGDIFLREDGLYFRAKLTFMLNETSGLEENPFWTQIGRGSLQNPKLLNSEEAKVEGDISYDVVHKKYYITSCSSRDLACVESEFDVKSRWMELMHDTIKDQRLHNLAIPATHDSGTWGINKKSTVVDGRVALVFLIAPHLIIDWARTQTENLYAQLSLGFRELDLRIADLGEQEEQEEGSGFAWWHSVSADPIEPGLKQIKRFIQQNRHEVVILKFFMFVQPGDRLPITKSRLELLNSIILSQLKPYMVQRGEQVPDLPTIGQVLATGKNCIAFMQDPYMQELSEAYWPISMMRTSHTARTNPEELFRQRSASLRKYKLATSDSISDLSGALSADPQFIAAGVGEDRSFEGVFGNIIDQTRFGTNTEGMHARDSRLYTSGVSVHYRGINDMYRYWLARPDLYKPNIFYVDDVHSSTIVDTAILANLYQIKREVAISFQGSPRTGFYEWVGITAVGGTDGLACAKITGRCVITSQEYQIENTVSFEEQPEVVFVEGQYPPDTAIKVQVTVDSLIWQDLYINVIESMINNNWDLYIRGSISKYGLGFAYVSRQYDLFGETCETPPTSGFVGNILWW